MLVAIRDCVKLRRRHILFRDRDEEGLGMEAVSYH